MKRITLLALTIGICLFIATGNSLATVTLTTLHIFTGADGNAPVAGLALGTNGNFYGTTQFGGLTTNDCVGSCGTLFEISPEGAFVSLHLFNFIDGSAPRAGLVLASDGNLYGTTFDGGASAVGGVFRLTASGSLTILNTNDAGCSSGSAAALIQASDGNLYGTRGFGVFQITTNGECAQLNVQLPQSSAAALIQGSDSNFYGTTQFGGTSTNCSSGCGTVFQLTPNGVLTILHSFDGSDGKEPVAGLVQGSDGNLYGTTSGGLLTPNCTAGCGTVFQITTNGVFTSLYAFSGTDGRQPRAGLVQGSDGNFYGTTFYGGAFGVGTVFQITTNGVLTRLISIGGTATSGAYPAAGLVQDANGDFYGTTQAGGGIKGLGTVFKLTISTNSSSASISCVLSPALATNTVGAAHTVTASVSSNGVARSGALVNFSITSGPNVSQTGTATTSASGHGSFTYNGTGGVGTDTIRAIATVGGVAATGTATKVWVSAPTGTHDLAVISIKPPAKVTLTAKKPSITSLATVQVQNLSTHNEVIPDATVFANLVTLAVHSLSNDCPDLVAMPRLPTKFPITLKPKGNLIALFNVTFNTACVPDRLPTSKTANHDDYQFIATVHHDALNGIPDTNPANDSLSAKLRTDVIRK